jgi:microcompartment protein CcmL/EutN
MAVLDGLYGDGETLKSLKALGFGYIIVVKEGDHEAVQRALQAGKTEEFESMYRTKIVT